MYTVQENHGRVNRFVWYTAIIIAVVSIDQLTKMLAMRYLLPVYDIPLIQDVLHLTYVENTGAAFGMMKDYRWLFMTASTVAIIGIFIYLMLHGMKIGILLGIALSFIAGGGIGNMIDRVIYKYVVDFINFELIDFAVFNGADSFITIGACMMILYIILYEIRPLKKNNDKPENAENGS